ncbi:MAG: type VI secretion system-associated protein TagF [Polyangiaceae bacterium]
MVGAFGKLALAGDFVRFGWSSEATRGFEEWLHQGIQVAHEKRGNAWKAEFGRGAVYGFVYRGADPASLLAGVMRPSFDSVGRSFPLAFFAPLQSAAQAMPAVVPFAVSDFLDAAASALLLPDPTVATFATTLETIGPPADPRTVVAEYERWGGSTTLTRLWGAIFGSDDIMMPATLIESIAQTVLPVKGVEGATSPLSLRLPLGGAGIVGVSFWLDVVCRLAGWKTTAPTFFWFSSGFAGDVLIQLGRTPASSLVELWSPDPKNEHVYDLRTVRAVLPAQQINPRILDGLRRASSIQDLLATLSF